MIRVMRNIGVRLWLTLLVSVPAGFYFLSWFSGVWAGPGMMGFFVCLAGFCYGVLSVLMHLAGTWMIQHRIHEAQAWEQAGIPTRAEKKYLQAVRIYDSFLLSPVRSRKQMIRLTRSLARFALTFDRKGNLFNQAVRVCLVSDPHDEALAVMWLNQVRREERIVPKDQALLTRLARSHSSTSGVMPLLARIFLDTGRVDFTARQVYSQVMGNPDLKPCFQQEIENLTLGQPGVLTPVSGKPVQEKRQQKLKTETPATAQQSVSGISETVRDAVGSIRSGIAGWRHLTARFINRVRTGIPEQIRWRPYLKAGILVCVFGGMVGFIYHTVFYLKTPEPVIRTEAVIEERVPRPFTIQVAAYLTDTHARNYVARLSQKGVDARIKTTTGGGKTWYLIHVSEFEDRQSAAAYGNRLISENIIEEFFVSNKQ